MLKKLFARKIKPTKTKPSAPQPKASAAVTTEPRTLEQWLAELNRSEGKAKAQALNALATKIQADEFQILDVLKAADTLSALMLSIQLDQRVSEQSQATWAKVSKDGFTAKVRKYAAAQVTDHDTLQSLIKDTKGKDKTVYRILQETYETQSVAAKQAEQRQSKIESVLQAAQRLSESAHEPMYEARLKGLIEQWRELSVTQDDVCERFEQARQQCEDKINKLKAEEAAIQEKAESIQMADVNRQQLIDQLKSQLIMRLQTMDVSDEELSEDQHTLAKVQHQWRETEQLSKTSKDEQRAFLKVCTAYEISLPRLKRLLTSYGNVDGIVARLEDSQADNEALLHDIDDWLHDVDFLFSDEKPKAVERLHLALEQYQKSLVEHRQQEINKVRSIRTQLRRCLSAVEEGSIRRASGLYHGVEEKLAGFNLEEHPGIRKQFEETTDALEKLRDWQSYAVLPKKEALIKKMEALTQHSMDPESRADTIREMQEEWKLLSRGLQNRQQDLWETFHDLAQKAYEPCREFFSEQRHLREVNLERRKEVIEQLRTYSELVNWDEPDIREIDRALQAARNDWRHFSPVDRVANKELQKEFDRLHHKMMEKLKAEQSVFRDNKLAIIERAKKLLDLEDVREATEQAKQLQKEWKTAGVVSRKNEQELWKSFREVCDQLFARREEQAKAFKADLDEHKTSAESIIKQIELLSKSEQVLQQKAAFEDLKAQYEKVGTLPKAHYAKLSRQFKEACNAFQKAAKQAKQLASDIHWVELIEWVKQVRFAGLTIEAAAEQWSTLSVPEAAQSLNMQIESWQQSPDEISQSLLHEKTVDLEIIAGAESPEADASMRMNLQVQRLSQGIGSQVTAAEIDRLVVDWLAVGSVDEAIYNELESRMKAARNHFLNQKAK